MPGIVYVLIALMIILLLLKIIFKSAKAILVGVLSCVIFMGYIFFFPAYPIASQVWSSSVSFITVDGKQAYTKSQTIFEGNLSELISSENFRDHWLVSGLLSKAIESLPQDSYVLTLKDANLYIKRVNNSIQIKIVKE